MHDPNQIDSSSSSSSSGSPLRVSDLAPLDNPIWHALITEQSSLSLGSGLARRFPAEIGPLCGITNPSAESYDALRPLAGPGGTAVLFFTEPCEPPAGWTMERAALLDQMICLAPQNPKIVHPAPEAKPRRLTAADVPAMLELAELTEPGPFGPRTIELGAFFGIFDSGRLLAMAGERLHMPQFVEISAVCTHPDARGRGYARILMAEVMKEIRQRGKTPFLHVLAANAAAISVYKSLGFTLRRTLHLAVLKNGG